MIKNVTYITGAGASAGALPVVNETSKYFQLFKLDLLGRILNERTIDWRDFTGKFK